MFRVTHGFSQLMKAICLWSGPRNVSTALMYSFAQRPDTRIVDEPLYGHFLRVTGTVHPGCDEVMARVNCDGNAVMKSLLAESPGGPDVLFMKQMAHHLVDVDRSFLGATDNIFLIRDPEQMLPSLTIRLPNASIFDTGLKMQWELFGELKASGQNPAIVDARTLLLDPQGILSALCVHLGIPFYNDMLHWESGPREEDGIWARHWYETVHESIGFSAYKHKTNFPAHLRPMLDECAPWYDKLLDEAIRASGPANKRTTT